MGSPETNMAFALFQFSFLIVAGYIVGIAVVGRILGWVGVKALAFGYGKVYFGIVAGLALAGTLITCLLYSWHNAMFGAAIVGPMLLVAAMPIANYFMDKRLTRS
jgi:hypothetical protein